MVAIENLSQLSRSYNSIASRHGVLTLFGYGIQVRVHRGHLIIEDGIGADRRHFRLPRVGHGLRRLIVIGADGMISLAALRWLSNQNAAFVMLERNGKVLAVTGPVRPSDAKLRRAQALAAHSGADLKIARELISRKLAGQEQVAREILRDLATADEINRFRESLPNAERLDLIRLLESQAAAAYWASWQNVPITFPTKDLPRVPQHWRAFGARTSLLTGSPRLACNPSNAALNYLYAILQAESRLAAATLGLDPGLGVLHVDTSARDSLACDLMEAVRPQVDRYLLTWLLSRPVRREWFFEQRDGNCRLMSSLASQLSESAPTWARAVAPIAEWVARAFWSTIKKPDVPVATRLTQSNKREAKGKTISTPAPGPRPENSCLGCGKPVADGSTHCAVCVVPVSRERMLELARQGRIASKSPESRARVAATQRRQALAWRRWEPSSKPEWLTEDVYNHKIQPSLLRSASISQIASALEVSIPYAANIRLGRRQPHPRHWTALAELVGIATPKISIRKSRLTDQGNQ
jgi:CRISPR-associated endonuclease Cas1